MSTLLARLGFGGAGITGGSPAAFIQSTLSNAAAAQRPFAVLQSAGMGGYGATIVHRMIQAGAVAAGGAATLMVWLLPDTELGVKVVVFTSK